MSTAALFFTPNKQALLIKNNKTKNELYHEKLI